MMDVILDETHNNLYSFFSPVIITQVSHTTTYIRMGCEMQMCHSLGFVDHFWLRSRETLLSDMKMIVFGSL